MERNWRQSGAADEEDKSDSGEIIIIVDKTKVSFTWTNFTHTRKQIKSASETAKRKSSLFVFFCAFFRAPSTGKFITSKAIATNVFSSLLFNVRKRTNERASLLTNEITNIEILAKNVKQLFQMIYPLALAIAISFGRLLAVCTFSVSAKTCKCLSLVFPLCFASSLSFVLSPLSVVRYNSRLQCRNENCTKTCLAISEHFWPIAHKNASWARCRRDDTLNRLILVNSHFHELFNGRRFQFKCFWRIRIRLHLRQNDDNECHGRSFASRWHVERSDHFYRWRTVCRCRWSCVFRFA